MLADPFSEEELQPRPMSHADCDYFSPMIDSTFQCAPIGDAEEESSVQAGELAECVA